jgi:hypothetical protein
MFSHVLSCSLMFSHVLSCSLMFSHVLSSSLMFSDVLSCSLMFLHAISFFSCPYISFSHTCLSKISHVLYILSCVLSSGFCHVCSFQSYVMEMWHQFFYVCGHLSKLSKRIPHFIWQKLDCKSCLHIPLLNSKSALDWKKNMHRLVEQTIMLLIMFSLPAKGQKFGKVFTLIQIIMIFFQLAKVSPMILQKKKKQKNEQ